MKLFALVYDCFKECAKRLPTLQQHVIFGDEILEAFGDVIAARVSLHRA